jgi:phytoene dehydrogenase-like protein
MLVAGNAMHTDLGPDSAGSALYGLLLAMLGQQHGFPVPEGGSGRLTDALVSRLRARGGVLRCSAPVTSVVWAPQGSRLSGWRRVNGSERSGRCWPTYRLRISTGPWSGSTICRPGCVCDLDRFDWDNATVKVNWATSAPVPWRSTAAAAAGTVHLGGDLDDLSRTATDLTNGTVPNRPFVLLGQMTTTDPSRSPAGTESVWAYAHLPRGRRSAEEVATFVATIEAEVERHAPGFRDTVVGCSVQSSADLERPTCRWTAAPSTAAPRRCTSSW